MNCLLYVEFIAAVVCQGEIIKLQLRPFTRFNVDKYSSFLPFAAAAFYLFRFVLFCHISSIRRTVRFLLGTAGVMVLTWQTVPATDEASVSERVVPVSIGRAR